MSMESAELLRAQAAPDAPGVVRVLSRPSGQHAVHFYPDDDSLCETVADFLAEARAAGDPLVVIATPSHRTALERSLLARGIDVARGVIEGDIRMLDAEATLAELIVDGVPSRERFMARIGGLVAELGRGGERTVRAYGEMVDVLWRSDQQTCALQLEQLWSELQRIHRVDLLCGYAMSGFAADHAGVGAVCGAHDRIVARDPEALMAELQRRRDMEAALRSAMRALEETHDVLQSSATHLQKVTDAVPALVAYVDADERYRFVNASYERWFEVARSTIIGRTLREVLGDAGYAALEPHVRRALAGEHVSFSATVPYRSGGTRSIEADYVPDVAPDGRVRGYVALVSDVSERAAAEQARDAAAAQAELLLRVVTAIADAVTPEEVHSAIVDRVSRALEAATAGLWIVDEDGRHATFVRSLGYHARSQEALAKLPIEGGPAFPALDAMRRRAPVFVDTKAELLERYPDCAPLTTPELEYGVACLPVLAQGQLLGVIGLTFDRAHALDAERRRFLHMVAHYAGQALERLRLLAHQQELRARAELLYHLAAAVIGAEREEDVLEPALDALRHAAGTERAAILAQDDGGIMRFRAWRGLSDVYRVTVEGHSPWAPDVVDPEPMLVPDVESDDALAGYLGLFRREQIRALAFIPLVNRGRLIGKLMLYFDRPRTISAHELEIVRAIAAHVAAALIRFSSFAELQRTVRFNELFTGMLGHDLRNPLSAMITAAQAALIRPEAEKLVRPLSRILSSGDRMARMIDQLLDFTRVRVGDGIPVVPTAIDLQEVLRHVVDELDDANPDWQLRLERTGDTRGVWDADRLAQVFSNLVGNAIQHGEIDHGVDVALDGTSAELVRVDVRNRGIIPADELATLFEPMVEGRRRERARGLGLGLYISREIARAHGGSIQVRSTPGEGTVFSVWLPRNAIPGGARTAT